MTPRTDSPPLPNLKIAISSVKALVEYGCASANVSDCSLSAGVYDKLLNFVFVL